MQAGRYSEAALAHRGASVFDEDQPVLISVGQQSSIKTAARNGDQRSRVIGCRSKAKRQLAAFSVNRAGPTQSIAFSRSPAAVLDRGGLGPRLHRRRRPAGNLLKAGWPIYDKVREAERFESALKNMRMKLSILGRAVRHD